jgi:hypothetical protein
VIFIHFPYFALLVSRKEIVSILEILPIEELFQCRKAQKRYHNTYYRLSCWYISSINPCICFNINKDICKINILYEWGHCAMKIRYAQNIAQILISPERKPRDFLGEMKYVKMYFIAVHVRKWILVSGHTPWDCRRSMQGRT